MTGALFALAKASGCARRADGTVRIGILHVRLASKDSVRIRPITEWPLSERWTQWSDDEHGRSAEWRLSSYRRSKAAYRLFGQRHEW
jgi:hypothetical protein